jgi:hypothetical protein
METESVESSLEELKDQPSEVVLRLIDHSKGVQPPQQ